jgi:alpha-1,6-mannosyltransferase
VRRAPAVVAGAVTLALAAAACMLAWQPDSPLVPRNGGNVSGGAPLFLALLACAFVAYLVALAATRRMAPSTRAAIVLAFAIQLVPLAAPLLLSTDAWTYWSYGWIGARGGGNPYADAPEAFPRNPALPFMGSAWVDTTSVYGPAFTIASEPLAAAAGDSDTVAAWEFKALAAASALAAALLAGRLARRRAFAIALVGWNPLLAVHLAGGGHNDGWVGALILAALALSASRRFQGAGALWALAIAVKWVPLLFLALRAVEARATGRPTAHRGFAITATAVAVVASVLYGGAWPLAVLPLLGNAALETSYAIPHRLEQIGVPDAAALAVAVAVFLAGFAWLTREAGRGRARLGLAACLVLVTTPYLAVWYLAWAVPLAAAEEDAAATVACLVLCAYLLPQTIPL